MKRITTSLISFLILTNAALAQAADGNNGAVHILAQKWVSTYAGETEVDGLPVTASLDEGMPNLLVPDVMAALDSTQVPGGVMPVVRKNYRLNLAVSHNPNIRIAYPVFPRTISVEGAAQFAFVSDLEPNKDFHFVITTEKEGTLHVHYTRKVTDGRVLEGDFDLSPVPHILGK